jgi:hypothetical protein
MCSITLAASHSYGVAKARSITVAIIPTSLDDLVRSMEYDEVDGDHQVAPAPAAPVVNPPRVADPPSGASSALKAEVDAARREVGAQASDAGGDD